MVCAPCRTCDSLRKTRVATLQRLARVPEVKQTTLWRVCGAFLESFPRIQRARQNWLFLSGKTGSGKTTQAALVASQIVDDYLTPTRFYNSVELFRSLRASERYQSNYDRIVNDVLTTRLVVFDDLLKDVPNERAFGYNDYKRPIIEALWTRYERRLPTIITTQATPDALRRFDEALFGRIVEASNGFSAFLNVDATDWRTKQFSTQRCA